MSGLGFSWDVIAFKKPSKKKEKVQSLWKHEHHSLMFIQNVHGENEENLIKFLVNLSRMLANFLVSFFRVIRSCLLLLLLKRRDKKARKRRNLQKVSWSSFEFAYWGHFRTDFVNAISFWVCWVLLKAFHDLLGFVSSVNENSLTSSLSHSILFSVNNLAEPNSSSSLGKARLWYEQPASFLRPS